MTPAQKYADEVVAHLGGVDRSERTRISSEIAAELDEYPEATTVSTLTERFGQPADYAATLAESLGLEEPDHKQRWPWVVASLAASLAVLGILVGMAGVDFGGTYGVRGPLAESSDDGNWDLEWVENGGGWVLLSVSNPGPRPISIRSVAMFPNVDSGERATLLQGKVLYDATESPELSIGAVDDPTTAAPSPVDLAEDPLRLSSGESRLLAVEFTFGDCEIQQLAEGAIYNSVLVEYSYLGIQKSERLTVPPVQVSSLEACAASDQ